MASSPRRRSQPKRKSRSDDYDDEESRQIVPYDNENNDSELQQLAPADAATKMCLSIASERKKAAEKIYQDAKKAFERATIELERSIEQEEKAKSLLLLKTTNNNNNKNNETSSYNERPQKKRRTLPSSSEQVNNNGRSNGSSDVVADAHAIGNSAPLMRTARASRASSSVTITTGTTQKTAAAAGAADDGKQLSGAWKAYGRIYTNNRKYQLYVTIPWMKNNKGGSQFYITQFQNKEKATVAQNVVEKCLNDRGYNLELAKKEALAAAAAASATSPAASTVAIATSTPTAAATTTNNMANTMSVPNKKLTRTTGIPKAGGSRGPKKGELVIQKDRRIYYAKNNETPLMISKKYPDVLLAKILFDNNTLYPGIKGNSKLRDYTAIVLPPSSEMMIRYDGTNSKDNQTKRKATRISKNDNANNATAVATTAVATTVATTTTNISKRMSARVKADTKKAKDLPPPSSDDGNRHSSRLHHKLTRSTGIPEPGGSRGAKKGELVVQKDRRIYYAKNNETPLTISKKYPDVSISKILLDNSILYPGIRTNSKLMDYTAIILPPLSSNACAATNEVEQIGKIARATIKVIKKNANCLPAKGRIVLINGKHKLDVNIPWMKYKISGNSMFNVGTFGTKEEAEKAQEVIENCLNDSTKEYTLDDAKKEAKQAASLLLKNDRRKKVEKNTGRNADTLEVPPVQKQNLEKNNAVYTTKSGRVSRTPIQNARDKSYDKQPDETKARRPTETTKPITPRTDKSATRKRTDPPAAARIYQRGSDKFSLVVRIPWVQHKSGNTQHSVKTFKSIIAAEKAKQVIEVCLNDMDCDFESAKAAAIEAASHCSDQASAVRNATANQIQRYAIGTEVLRRFPAGSYLGRIVEYDADCAYYLVKYDDGDEEEFSDGEGLQEIVNSAQELDKETKQSKPTQVKHSKPLADSHTATLEEKGMVLENIAQNNNNLHSTDASIRDDKEAESSRASTKAIVRTDQESSSKETPTECPAGAISDNEPPSSLRPDSSQVTEVVANGIVQKKEAGEKTSPPVQPDNRDTQSNQAPADKGHSAEKKDSSRPLSSSSSDVMGEPRKDLNHDDKHNDACSTSSQETETEVTDNNQQIEAGLAEPWEHLNQQIEDGMVAPWEDNNGKVIVSSPNHEREEAVQQEVFGVRASSDNAASAAKDSLSKEGGSPEEVHGVGASFDTAINPSDSHNEKNSLPPADEDYIAEHINSSNSDDEDSQISPTATNKDSFTEQIDCAPKSSPGPEETIRSNDQPKSIGTGYPSHNTTTLLTDSDGENSRGSPTHALKGSNCCLSSGHDADKIVQENDQQRIIDAEDSLRSKPILFSDSNEEDLPSISTLDCEVSALKQNSFPLPEKESVSNQNSSSDIGTNEGAHEVSEANEGDGEDYLPHNNIVPLDEQQQHLISPDSKVQKSQLDQQDDMGVKLGGI